MIFAGTGCCPLGCWPPTQRRTAKSRDENQNFKGSTQTKSCREKVSQVRFHLTLSTNHFDQGLFHAVLKKSCLGSYKNATYFQINLKGLGSELWIMQGHIPFSADVVRRNARTRLREKLIASFKQLSLPPRKEKEFADILDQNLDFVTDDSVLSGETHSWKVKGENAPAFLPELRRNG